MDPKFRISTVPYDPERDSLVQTSLVREFQAAARDARRHSASPVPFAQTVHDVADVACPVRAPPDSSPVQQPPAFGPDRINADIFTAFVVDTSGRVDSTTVRTIAPGDSRELALVRAALTHWQLVPARRAGLRVPQLVNSPIFLEPKPPDLSADTASEAVRADSIFAALYPVPAWVEELADSSPRTDHELAHIVVKPRPPEVRYDPRAELQPLMERSAAADALGWPPLADLALPNDEKEIRIYKGLLIGYPHDGLRLVVRDHAVTGTWFRYWPRDRSSSQDDSEDAKPGLDSLLRVDERGRCDSFHAGRDAVACVVQFAHNPNWGAVLKGLNAANLWDLPDESALGRQSDVIDGWGVWVEVRQGAKYRTYQYNNPQALGLREGDNALRIMRAVDSLVPLARPSSRYRAFRGYLLIRPTLANFVPCERGAYWQMAGNLGRIAPFLSDTVGRDANRATTALYLEGAGAFAPARSPASGGSPAVRAEVAADTLMVIRAADPSDCR
jgi:hypothetical protein